VTAEHDDDADLAPVTDLFGARSRRRAGDPRSSPADASPADEQSGQPPQAGRRRPEQADERTDDHSTDHSAGRWGVPAVDPVADAATDTTPDTDADAPVPLPIRGARTQAEWLSPVVGDGSGRSARSEQDGYDTDTEAQAASASVFAIAGGAEIDPADAPRPVAEQRADAERLSMRALGRKGISESELRTLLTRQELDADVVEYEIERLTRVGLLDDVALATDLVDRLHDRKGLGRQGVVAELRRRGIDQVAIDAALEAAADDEDDEFVRANELAEKRAGQLRGLDRATAERRLSGFLMRKGYSGGVVRVAVERALDGGGRRPAAPRGPVRFE
jgi:regulatory protein